jgi:hypothetical protein
LDSPLTISGDDTDVVPKVTIPEANVAEVEYCTV